VRVPHALSRLVPVTAACAAAGCGLVPGGAATTGPAATGPGSAPPVSASAAVTPGASATSAASATSRASATSAAPATPAAKLAQAQRTHEYPGPALRQGVVGGWRNPAQAVQVFADTYVNWTAATVSDRLRALAEVSVGQARSAVTLQAAQSVHDYELHRGGIANSGVVEAVAPVRGRARQYVVVTLERTTAAHSAAYQGLAPAWHVALATVTPVGAGLWVLSAWQPES
jgi:hypothetical protein